MIDQAPEVLAATLNAHRGGFNEALGLSFVRASAEEVVAELELGAMHTQPYGIVHGGVYASVIETVCSTGAALTVVDASQSAVGLDNQTSFLKACRGGKVRAVARPIRAGRRTQLWRGEITDERGHLLATGQVRLLILEQGAQVAGLQPDGKAQRT